MRAQFVFEFAKNRLSKYYAPEDLIEHFIDKVEERVPMDQIREIIEPAAGDGALIPFIENLASRYNIKTDYYDLNPDPGTEIKEMDFFDLTPDPYFDEHRLIITGPPYGEPGKTSKLWIKFAQKASEIAGYVAFISPHTWLDVKNPVPNLEQIYQEDMGWVTFRGSKSFGGQEWDVKTAIFIYKTILSPEKEDFTMVDKDFDITMYQGWKDKDKKTGEYWISSWGDNSGEVSKTGISRRGRPFSRAIIINVKNEKRRRDLEIFLRSFEEDYKPLIKKYAATTQNIFHLRRFKSFLKEALYES